MATGISPRSICKREKENCNPKNKKDFGTVP